MKTRKYSSRITRYNPIYELMQYYLIPNAYSSSKENLVELYCFLAKVQPFELTKIPKIELDRNLTLATYNTDSYIDTPSLFTDQSVFSYKKLIQDIFAAIRITSADIAFVVPRIDWISGTYYDEYMDTTNMFYSYLKLEAKPNPFLGQDDQNYNLKYIKGSNIIYFNNINSNNNGYIYTKEQLQNMISPGNFVIGDGILEGSKIVNYDFDFNSTLSSSYFYIEIDSPIQLNIAQSSYATPLSFTVEYYDRKKFYVKNSVDQVFICLDNAKGDISTQEPVLSYDTGILNKTVYTTDGYSWRYLYTLDQGQKYKFMDSNWMPIKPQIQSPTSFSSTAGLGQIDVIKIIDGGSGFTHNQYADTIKVNIVGDGVGATAQAEVSSYEGSGGYISRLTITNPGNNYTYATVTVQDLVTPENTQGMASANLIPVISPIGGHGSNIISELGARHVMVSLDISGTENGNLPVDLAYYQIGLMLNPYTKTSYPNFATNRSYSTSYKIIISPGSKGFSPGEVVYQGETFEKCTFSAIVVEYNSSTNVLSVVQPYKYITKRKLIKSATKGNDVARVVVDYIKPDFLTDSGYIIYVENRDEILRSNDATEQLKMVIEY